MHLIQKCPSLHQHRVRRHNDLLSQVTTWMRQRQYECRVEPRIPTGNTFIKPDLIASKDGEFLVIDLCCPWEKERETLQLAESAKVAKYSAYDIDIRRYLRQEEEVQVNADTRISYHGLAVGARGGIRNATRKFLRQLGIGQGGSKTLATMAIERSIAMVAFLSRSQ